jgi:Glu-tRNA(Gln) amidotransferase subunit E-like FAD-binding protein
MYPDTDSPPTRLTRDRVERLRSALPALPWEREARYSGAGVPLATIHYLIRRGGADLVDRITGDGDDEPDRALLRKVCFFFGERAKGWRRAGVAVDSIAPERWKELFATLAERPVLWDAVPRIVTRMAACPDDPLDEILAALELDDPPAAWRGTVIETVRARLGEYHGLSSRARRRWHLGQALGWLRGRVAVEEVAGAVDDALAKDETE